MSNATEPQTDDHGSTLVVELRARADALERQLDELKKQTESRLVFAELKAEALRAGMVDLDGLRLVGAPALRINERGELEGGPELMQELRRTKPWLFGNVAASSSSTISPPQVQAVKQRLATEMTDAEYRIARAAIIRRRP